MEDPLDFIEKDSDNNKNEPLHIGLKILAFIIPLSGAIMYFIYKDDQPTKSKDACYAALFGMALGFIMNLMGSIVR